MQKEKRQSGRKQEVYETHDDWSKLQQSFAGCILANQSDHGLSATHNEHQSTSSTIWNVGNDYCRYMNDESYPLSTKDLWRPPRNGNLVDPDDSVKTSKMTQDNDGTGFHSTRNFIHQSTVSGLQLGNNIEGCGGFISTNNYINKQENQNSLAQMDQNASWLTSSFSNSNHDGYGGQGRAGGGLYFHPERSSSMFGFNNLLGHHHHFPAVSSSNAAGMDLSSPHLSNSLGLNISMDLMNCASNHGVSCNTSSTGNMSMQYDHHHHVQQSISDSPSHSSNKTSTSAAVLRKEVVSGTKKFKSYPNEMKPTRGVAKKTKTPSQSSSPILKVRKEKLGDRIAALHRLVAPFGKTDTASVLTEAIGYIQFLQDQIQTLSMPYMKSTRSKLSTTPQPRSSMGEINGAKIELRIKGLCLVPLSFTSYLSTFNNGGI